VKKKLNEFNMNTENGIIARFTFLNSDNDDEVIFDTTNSYELTDKITYPSESNSSSILVNSRIVINDIKYVVVEIVLDLLNSDSKIFAHNLQLMIYISKVLDENIAI